MSEALDELTDEPPIAGELPATIHEKRNPATIHKKRYPAASTSLLLYMSLWCFSELIGLASATAIDHPHVQPDTPLLEKRKSIPHNVTHDLNQSTSALAVFLIPVLVLASGLFAGLTIGYMSLDSTQLAVLAKSGTPAQQLFAQKIAPLRAKGHMLLVTLLIANMIANETLPIVTEKALGGGIQAIIISTVLVIVFSEIIPQTVCARYALRIGAVCAKPVAVLIYLLYPIVWPISRLLSKLIGEHTGVIYRPAELKELVNLHARKSQQGGDLAEDVVTIIGSAIDLQERVVQDSMTALDNCFMLDINSQLNYKTMSAILSSGRSRIPVYENIFTPAGPGRRIVGALLTKQLILIDPEDGILLREFPLNPLPHVASDMPLLNILNSFQEGRSHLAVVCPPANTLAYVELEQPKVERGDDVSRESPKTRPWWSILNKRKQESPSPHPGEALTLMTAMQPSKALLTDQPLGIISLEDVLEALLGEPIYDETDLDEHGHMAVPPYVPPEAATALRKEGSSFTAPSPVYDAKASAYHAAGSSDHLGHPHSIQSVELQGRTAAAPNLNCTPSIQPHRLSMESVPANRSNSSGTPRIASLYSRDHTTILPEGMMGGEEMADVHCTDGEMDLHGGLTTCSQRCSWIRQQKRSTPAAHPVLPSRSEPSSSHEALVLLPEATSPDHQATSHNPTTLPDDFLGKPFHLSAFNSPSAPFSPLHNSSALPPHHPLPPLNNHNKSPDEEHPQDS